MPISEWDEDAMSLRQGSRETGSARIGKGGGASVLTVKVTAAKLAQLQKASIETARASSSGRIHRTNPAAHPLYQWHFCRDFDNIQGVSFQEKVETDPEGLLEVPGYPFATKYQLYEIQARFEPRSYPMLMDANIPSYTLTWYDADGASQSRTAYREWWRNVTWVSSPAAEYLTADKGMNTFSIPTPITGSPSDGASAGVGVIRKLIPGTVWHARWHYVPYSYVLSTQSYFSRYIGHVNQTEWEGFPAGHALLQAVSIDDIEPVPFPEFYSYGGAVHPSQEKTCSVTFVILEANRTAAVTVVPTNPNHIAAGHNVVPWAGDMKYYYCEAFKTGGPGTGVPIYPSTVFELLFQNPDTA